MDKTEARARVERIKDIAPHDDEDAHCKQDALWYETLRTIAAGTADPQGLARIAIETNEIEFSRWYA